MRGAADGSDATPGAERAARDAGPGPPAHREHRPRADVWIPLAYAVISSAWIAVSDRLVLHPAHPASEQAWWSLVKGVGFVLVTAALLHLGIRRALERERRAHRALAEREALLRAISDATPDPIFVKDRESRWLFANPGVLQVLGFPADQVLGRTDLEIYRDRALAEALVAADRRVMESGRAEVLEERVETPAGVRLFLSAKAPYRDAEGRVIGVIGSARDITDREAVAGALRTSEERLRLFVEHAPAAIAMLDRDLRYLAVSRRWFEDYRLPQRDLVGLSHYEVFPEVPERWREIHQRCLGGAAERCEEEAFRRADGTVDWIRWDVRPWRDGGGAIRGLIIFTEQITARKEAEARARAAEEALQQSRKLESVGRLAGGVAHDFNNLLTVILSGAAALRDDLAAGRPAEREYVEEIHAAGERARDLTRQLLAFARKQVIAPVPLDLNEVVRGTEKLLRRVLGEDVELRVELAEGLWPTRADPGQIEQVILNLAVNARDAMPRGGALLVATCNVPGAGEGGPPGAGDAVSLRVRDTGVGMTPAVKAHAFEPFFTTKRTGEGTGLGLSTVHGIVHQCGGEVRLESEPDRGATFDLRFPRCAAAAAPPARAAPAGTRRGSETVLVVEDDPQVRDVTVRALRGAGHRVLEAATGDEALALAGGGERPALVVTDVVMPGLDGRALVDELRRRHGGDLRALFVSGYTQDVIHHHGVLDSGVDFLPKPFTPATLIARVRAVLDGA
jgi:PAS domain S-box-containing protein